MKVESGAWPRYAVLICTVALFLLPSMRVASRNGDEAISLEGAQRVLDGQIPGRDFFEVVGPGEFYWQALFFKLFGTNIDVSRGLLWVTGIALVLLIYHLSRRIGGGGFLAAGLFAVAGIARFSITSYHWDADLFGLLAFAFLVEWQRKPQTWMLLTAAAFAGVTTTIMQQKGLLLTSALLLSAYLVRKESFGRRQVLWFLAAASAPIAALLCFYAEQRALLKLIETDLLWPAQHYLALNGCPYGMDTLTQSRGIVLALEGLMRPSLASIFGGFLGLPLWLIVLLPALLLCFALPAGNAAFSRPLLPFWLCGAALWIAECQRPDYSHLVWACPIWLALLSSLVKWKASLSRALGLILAISCVLLGLIEFSVALGASVPLPARNGTLYAHRGDEVLEYLGLHARRGEEVFVYPYDGMYNFLSDTRNPTRYTYLFHGMHTPEQFREVVSDLDKKRVRLVLWDNSFTPEVWKNLFPYYKAPKSSELIIENYLLGHYHQIERRNGFRIMERNGS